MSEGQKDLGKQIGDALSRAMQSQEFKDLTQSVEEAIKDAATAISQGINTLGSAAADARARYAAGEQDREAAAETRRAELYERNRELARKRQEQARENLLFANMTAKTSGNSTLGLLSILLMVLGASEIWKFFILPDAAFFSNPINVAGAFALVVGVFIFIGSFKNRLFLKRFASYRKILGARTSIGVDELSAQTNRSAKSVLRDVKKMITRGFFKQGHLNDTNTVLMVTDQEYENYRRGLAARREYDSQKAAKKAADDDLSPKVRAVVARGEEFLEEIRAGNEAIESAEVSQKIDRIERVTMSIFDRARQNPDVVDDLDRLMDYYLPMTVKLLATYVELDMQPCQGENILKSKREIVSALDTLNVAFEKLLDSIFNDVAWDISSDVCVLNTVLAQEGLTENPFRKGC